MRTWVAICSSWMLLLVGACGDDDSGSGGGTTSASTGGASATSGSSSSTTGSATTGSTTSTANGGTGGSGTGGEGTGGSGTGGGATVCPPQTGAGTVHNGETIEADTTWRAEDGPHTTPGFIVAEGAVLTIEPCTEVRFDVDGVVVEGRLVAEGLPDGPIRFVSADPDVPWTGVGVINGGTASLANATLSGGGDPADPNLHALLDIRGADPFGPTERVVEVHDVTIEDSLQFGVSLRDSGAFTANSSGLTITGSQLGAIEALPRLAGSIPDGSYTGNEIDRIVLVSDEWLTTDTTIRDLGVVYQLGGDNLDGTQLVIGYDGSPPTTLSIEPGVEIRVMTEGFILASADDGGPLGTLVAVGTEAAPIVFTSALESPAPGDWVGIIFEDVAPETTLTHTEVRFAGGASLASGFHCEAPDGTFGIEDAAITAYGQPDDQFITMSLIADSARHGLNRAWRGSPLDLMPTNTFSNVTACRQTYPRDEDGGCPDPTPCD